MGYQWVKRRAHTRRTKSGKLAYIPVSWSLRRKATRRSKAKNRSPCPKCGSTIISIRMPSGGWGHFEGGKGLSRIKHPCFTRGDSLSRKRDQDTRDLFDLYKPGAEE